VRAALGFSITNISRVFSTEQVSPAFASLARRNDKNGGKCAERRSDEWEVHLASE